MSSLLKKRSGTLCALSAVLGLKKLIVRITRQRLWKYSRITSSEKPKNILEGKLIKYNLPLRKIKRTVWDFPKESTIQNTLLFIAI